TERVVSYLTEELVAQGHDVTLFASGDSATSARLVAPCKRALRLDDRCRDALAAHFRMLGQAAPLPPQFHLLPSPTPSLHSRAPPPTSDQPAPTRTTPRGPRARPERPSPPRQCPGQPLVPISDAQPTPLPFANWVATVHHGLPPGLHPFRDGPGKYLAFLGR